MLNVNIVNIDAYSLPLLCIRVLILHYAIILG